MRILTIVVATTIAAMLSQAQVYVDVKKTAFTPTVPSSSTQTITYNYRFCGDSGGGVSDSTGIYTQVVGVTTEDYTIGSTYSGRGAASSILRQKFWAACNTPYTTTSHAGSYTSSNTTTTYSPNETEYDAAAANSTCHAADDSGNLITVFLNEAPGATGVTGHIIISKPYADYYNINGVNSRCPPEHGHVEGWDAYIDIHLVIPPGYTPPPIPGLPGAGGNIGDGTEVFEIYNPALNGSSQFQFLVVGTANDTFTLEYSSDLSSWSALLSNQSVGSTGQYPYTDTGSNGSGVNTRFYRVKKAGTSTYGVNTLGFNRVSKPSAKSLILLANQFNLQGNYLSSAVTGVPNGTVAYLWNSATSAYDISSTYSTSTGWSKPFLTVNPGESFFLSTSSAIATPFYGYVPTGSQSVAITTANKAVSSILPKSGLLSVLGLSPVSGDGIYKWNVTSQAYENNNYFGSSWDTTAPSVGVSEGFLYIGGSARNWTQSYTTGL